MGAIGGQQFYGIIVQHFARLAAAPSPQLAHLDSLVPLLLSATAEVPFYAASVARARLLRSQQSLSAALKTPGWVSVTMLSRFQGGFRSLCCQDSRVCFSHYLFDTLA
jgi:hypothetical protein